MAELSVRCPGFSLTLDRQISIAALRYLDAASVTSHLRDCTGAVGPVAVGAAARTEASAEWILAWRSPTETLVLTNRAAALEALAARLAGVTDACLVDQSGGIWVLRLSGARVADVLVRLGSTTAIPAPGQARTSRLAELTVTAVCVEAGETLLLVDRLYAEHLLAWIRETIADF